MRTLACIVLCAVGSTTVSLAQNRHGHNNYNYSNAGHGNGQGNNNGNNNGNGNGNGQGNNGNGNGGSNAHAPEIDPTSAVGALMLLSGGAMVIVGRKTRLPS